MKKIFKHLTFYVIIAIVAGVLLGHYNPTLGIKMKVISEVFISIIKCFVPPIIFFTIVLGISSMGDLKKVGRIGLKSLIYFEIVTTIALAIGIWFALMFKPGSIDISNLEVHDVSKYTSKHETFSWLNFLKSNLTIQILLIAIFLGISLNYSKRRSPIVKQLDKYSKFVFKLLKYVMFLAPVAAFAGIAYTVGEYGLDTLIPLGKLVITVYFTMIVFVLVILGLIMRYFKLNIFKFLKYIKEEIIIVLGTSSSETALPNLMTKLEKLGCKKSVVGLVVPTGYSFNLDGTSIYLSMSVIFLAQIYNVPLTFNELLLIIGILMVTSKGAAGVTGSGFVVLASTLGSLHKIPVEGLAFLFGVDKFLSEARAITNIIGNGVATLVIAKSEKEFDADVYKKEIENEEPELI
jgi:aerobic C4-dicarboxylate transport protein